MQRRGVLVQGCIYALLVASGCSEDAAAGGAKDSVASPTSRAGAVGAAGSGGAAMTSIDCPVVDSTTGPGTARTVSVDAAKVIGTIRSLQGAHWDPGAAKGALSNHYAEMGVDMIRTHDAGGINGSGAGDMGTT
jgi:hypothetical protein